MKVIIADDSKAMRAIIARQIADLNFEIKEASNGEEAFDLMLAEAPIDLLITDWNMPGLRGLELVQKIRSQERFDATKILVVTSEVEAESMLKALQAGADEYLMKPFAASALREKIEILNLNES